MKHPFIRSPSQTHEDCQERIPNELLCKFIFYARRMFLGLFLSVAIILSAYDYTELIESRWGTVGIKLPQRIWNMKTDGLMHFSGETFLSSSAQTSPAIPSLNCAVSDIRVRRMQFCNLIPWYLNVQSLKDLSQIYILLKIYQFIWLQEIGINTILYAEPFEDSYASCSFFTLL